MYIYIFFLKVKLNHAMKIYREAELYIDSFLTLTLGGVTGQLHAPTSLPLWMRIQYPLSMRLSVSHLLFLRRLKW
jgi:hypothetical protein